MRTLKLLWYDIKGYLIARSLIRKQQKTVDFNRLGLRVDWVNRVYTVINPSEGDKGDDSEMLRIKAQTKMLEINKYIDKIGLSEYVTVSAEKIPETDSYLLVYYPIFRILTVWKFIMFVLTVIGIVWAYFKFF